MWCIILYEFRVKYSVILLKSAPYDLHGTLTLFVVHVNFCGYFHSKSLNKIDMRHKKIKVPCKTYVSWLKVTLQALSQQQIFEKYQRQNRLQMCQAHQNKLQRWSDLTLTLLPSEWKWWLPKSRLNFKCIFIVVTTFSKKWKNGDEKFNFFEKNAVSSETKFGVAMGFWVLSLSQDGLLSKLMPAEKIRIFRKISRPVIAHVKKPFGAKIARFIQIQKSPDKAD